MGGKIVVVEDEEAIRLGLRDSLEMEGYKVFAAADGATGLALATLSLAVVLAIIQIPIAWRIVARACSQPNLQSREQNA